ncbi:ABC transporter substrate-binding protein [Thermicanus aegyptius]|uniref:ABC transporter substrate-binding protein n=1 Tax=Thermicanus aegyptius TaxID=94009 RepID=UPI00041437FE|nr:ABC transporter substrate-binding protein [Thermicanus aegyptius]
MRRKGMLLFFALVLLWVLAACGQQTGSKGEPGQGGTAAPTGGTLIFGRGADSTALDPINVTDGESLIVTDNIFNTLVDYKPDSTEVVPSLAKEWKSSEDGLTWTFSLQEGVKFHDGTDFDAEAVVYNFNRWMDPNHPQHKGDFGYYAYMFGGFKGDPGHVIKEVVAKDKYTVEFHLNFPQAPFLNNLAMSPFGIASPAAIEKYGEKFGDHPVGTGPFKFVEWKKGDSITLEKNPDYWKKGLPKLDKVVFRSIPDNSNRFTALKNGEIDLMDGLNPEDVPSVKSNDKLQLFLRPSMNVAYLAFNTKVKPLDDKRVRQALNMTVNKKEIIDSFFAGLAEPAKNPMPPSLWGYNDQVEDYPVDLEKAKSLLAEAGYPNGFETDLWYMTEPRPYMPNGQKVAEVLQADFAKIGVKVNLVTYDWSTYLDKTGNGEHPMALMGWTGDNGDPDNFLYVLLDKDNTRTPDAGNIAFYVNDALHDLLIRAQRSTNQEERIQLYMEAQKIIHEDAPWIPLVHTTPPIAGIKEIKGYIPHPTGTESFENVSIEK